MKAALTKNLTPALYQLRLHKAALTKLQRQATALGYTLLPTAPFPPNAPAHHLSSSEAYCCRPLSISYFDHKLLVASIRFTPADIDNPLSPIGVAVKRLAIDRVPFELVGSHAVEHGPLLLRGRGPRLESGFGQQRFFNSHFVACAAHSRGYKREGAHQAESGE
jgi:hypothetical protein